MIWLGRNGGRLRPPFGRLLAVLALLWCFASQAPEALAHAVLLEVAPADGAVLDATPDQVRLLFNEPVRPLFLRLIDTEGRNLLPTGAVHAEDVTVEAKVPAIGAGSYLISYRVVSTDGHPIGGSFAFRIGAGTTQIAAPPSDAATEAFWLSVSAALRFAIYGLITLAAGGGIFRVLIAFVGSPIDGALRRYTAATSIACAVALAASIGIEGAFLSLAPAQGLLDPATWRLGASGPAGSAAGVSIVGLVLILASLRAGSSLAAVLGLTGALVTAAGLAFTGHAAAASPRLLTVPSVVLHVIAASVWIGSLWPLVLSLRRLDIDAAAIIVQRFSWIAAGAVAALFVAGTALAVVQVENVSALWETKYGLVFAAKLAGVGVLLALAALNKWWLTPALRRGEGATILRRSIAAEFGIAGGVLLATAGLGSTPPPRALGEMAMHHSMQAAMDEAPTGYQVMVPSGNFVARIDIQPAQVGANTITVSLNRAADDATIDAPEVQVELGQAEKGVEPLARRLEKTEKGIYRLAGVELSFSGTWSVRVDALVTDFQKAMFESDVLIQSRFTTASIAHGAAIFAEHCVACHGTQGRGDGPAASGLTVKPADLTAGHLFDHSPYDLFGWVSAGKAKGVMPGFAPILDEDSRWNVVDFVRANGGGRNATERGFGLPTRAPDMPVSCPDGKARWLSDLAGQVVHLVFADGSSADRLAALVQIKDNLRAAGAVSVAVADDAAIAPPGLCVARAPEAGTAYGVSIGQTGVPKGTELLVDGAGWLRERWGRGQSPNWETAGVLRERVLAVRTTPVGRPVMMGHNH